MSSLGALAGGGGMLALITPSGKVPGTGLLKVTEAMKKLLAGSTTATHESTERLKAAVLGELPGLFGDYPHHSDLAPSGIFLAIFAIFFLSHMYVFLRNYKSGQIFWPSFGLAMYCIFRIIGFGLRINWSSDIMRVEVGIASTVFSVVPVTYISVMNMLFGHRIFTWRHPETGNAVWFNTIMTLTYVFVLGVIVMGILGQAIPFLYYLDQHHLNMCHHAAQAAAILQTLYAFAGLFLIQIAYTFKPGTIDHRFGRFYKAGEKMELPQTVSPTWIESTAITYFPRKGSQIRYFKDQAESKAIRVIANRRSPAGGLSNHHSGEHYNGPKMTTAVILIIIVSILLSISAAFRTASTFILHNRGGVGGAPLNSWIYHKWLMYFFFGVFEVIVNVLYLALRADLRFYIPDMPTKRKDGQVSTSYAPNVEDPNYPSVMEAGINTSKPEIDHVNDASFSSSENTGSQGLGATPNTRIQ